MKELKSVFLILFCFFLTEVVSQDCKYSKKMGKYAQKRLESEKIVNATKFEVTFKDFNEVGSTHFVKSDTGYFMGLVLVRDFTRKMGVMADNPMIFKLKNDSLVTLYPDRSKSDRGGMSLTSPMGTKVLRTYYKVTSEQLPLFASVPITNVKIYTTFKKKTKQGDNELDILEFEIKKEKWRSKFMASAKCILQ